MDIDPKLQVEFVAAYTNTWGTNPQLKIQTIIVSPGGFLPVLKRANR
jgi:hypothetical protein